MNPSTVPPASAPDPDRVRFYADDAAWYVKQLPLEHFMHSTAQSTQEAITAASFDLIAAARPEIQCFGELLIQYPVAGQRHPGRVVPDNFVVVHPAPLDLDGSFPLELVPAGPLLVMEYVSKGNWRKDYDANMTRYEQVLRGPDDLLFSPDNAQLSLFRLAGGKYASVFANDAGRFAVPELELEVGLVEGWVRFWFRGELVPLPAELNRSLIAERAARATAERERDGERAARLTAEVERDGERAARLALEAELARLRAQLGSP